MDSKRQNKHFFLDTSALSAIVLKNEAHHQYYLELLESLAEDPGVKMLTSDYIIDEWVTLLRCKAGIPMKNILNIWHDLQKSGLKIEYISKNIFYKAFQLLEKYHDHFLSFTDVTSVALMKELGINRVFTLDKDFLIFKFQII